MAAPLAHIFLAIQMLEGPFKGLFNEKEFIIGTSFPDIRYLKVIARTETHFPNVSLQDILKEKSSFKAGMLFHSFVDEKREEFMVKNNIYNKLPSFKFTSQSLKFAEDEILKSQFDITNYQSYFDKVLDIEKTYNIQEKYLIFWHKFLQGYFKGDNTRKDFIMKFLNLNNSDTWFVKRYLFSWYYTYKIEKAMLLIIHDIQMRNLILDFYINFGKKYNVQ